MGKWSAGILRGHSGRCPHRISRVHHKVPAALTQDTNPDVPGLTHAVTMAVSLEQVHDMIASPHSGLPAVPGPDLMQSVLWMWHVCRCGIAVSIRGGELALFVPFCNPDYTNTWSNRARSSVGAGLPADKWWANGWTLCGDYVPPQLWGDQGICAIQNMLMVACQQCVMSDCDFLINKRDSACVRRDYCDPMNPMDAYQQPMSRPSLVPVLSPYVGDQFADIAMPLPSDWHRLSRGSFAGQNPEPPVPLPREVPWAQKRDCAVFRGSLTGTGRHAGTHQRLALLRRHDGDNYDFRGTGKNARLRYCPLEHAVVVPQSAGIDVGRQHYIPQHRQQELYRYTVTIDGHSGADRLAALAGGNQIILKVDPPAHALCPETWASTRMHAWEHYIPVARDLSDLDARVAWARANTEACDRLLRNCKRWARGERSRIIAWWAEAAAAIRGGRISSI